MLNAQTAAWTVGERLRLSTRFPGVSIRSGGIGSAPLGRWVLNGVDCASLEPNQKYALIGLGNAVMWIWTAEFPAANSEAWLLPLLSRR